MTVTSLAHFRVFEIPTEGRPLGTERDALDLIGEAYGHEIDIIVIPVARLHPDFLKLRTGMAGAFLQKMQNYGYRVAIVGDIAGAVFASQALRDFVYEANKVGRVLFADDPDELAQRIIALGAKRD